MASHNPATLTDKFVTAVLLLIAIFSYRTVLMGGEPGGGKAAEQLRQASGSFLALQTEASR